VNLLFTIESDSFFLLVGTFSGIAQFSLEKRQLVAGRFSKGFCNANIQKLSVNSKAFDVKLLRTY
jgi:hypothetical protein